MVAHSSRNQRGAGILRVEKIASDGTTQLPVLKLGRARLTLSGSCTTGDALILSETPNMVQKATNISTVSGLNIFAIAEEDATTGQTLMAWVNPHVTKGDTGY
jgi:hypothetical protein